MSFKRSFCQLTLALLIPLSAQAREVARFSMDNKGNRISDLVSGKSFEINSVNPAENIDGANGKALRFDGYSTYIDAQLGEFIPAGSKKMTASVLFAIETYPVVEIDVNTPEQAAIASCLDEEAKTGFGFFIGIDGKYSFKTFIGGWPLEMRVDKPLRQYEWIYLTAVVDAEKRSATLYNNGEVVATSKANGNVTSGNSTLRIGRSLKERYSGPFCLTSFNGAIDEIAVWDEALSPETVSSWKADSSASLTVTPARFADDVLRPAFHGMPGANWTNETHGLTYSNGRYHLFFQKNANGPYMTRLHWGHLSSENLYDWQEEQIALTPDTSYDMKGCWSGCVFSDEEITQGKPSVIYTGVDYGKAVIAQANPLDEDLIGWQKLPVPVINGRPAGLSDDFRDPYFFRTDNGAYIIVGSSKSGVGTTTLHTYNSSSRSWSNDGKTFFTGANAASSGTFWEMPNVTEMGDKWLFTVTPQNTAKGVASLYWVGTINADGTFLPDKATPTNIELPGFARDGFGMLSPTIFQKDGKTVAIGIVPDKLPSQVNYDLGYAHTYSLPREWSLDSEGKLCQKPYSGLKEMRESSGFSKSEFILAGNLTLDGIKGRCVELSGEFTVTNGKCGFTLLDDGVSAIKIYYDGATNEIVVDNRGVDRYINDSGVFDGYYHSVLPRQLAKGETIKLNVFFDHSILDIFINDTWATSARIFAKEKTNENTTVFADGDNKVKSVEAWNLNVSNSGAGVNEIIPDSEENKISVVGKNIEFNNVRNPAILSVYNIASEKLIERTLHNESGCIPTELSGIHIITLRTSDGMISRKVNFR